MVDGNVDNPLKEVVLHDTAMTSVQVSFDQLACRVEVEGSGGEMPKGQRKVVACGGLHSIFASFNFAELRENVWPGNVQDGHFSAAGVFRLYLTGGMFEAGATSLTVCDSVQRDGGNFVEPLSVVISGFDGICSVDFDMGFLQHLDVSFALGKATAHVLIRVGDGSSGLVPAVLSFSGMKSCNMRLDVAAMKDSVRFGNIRTLHLHAKSGIVWLYCREGFVEIIAEHVELSCERPASAGIPSSSFEANSINQVL